MKRYESKWFLRAVLAMQEDRFSDEEIAIGLNANLSDVRRVLNSIKAQSKQQGRLQERYWYMQ